MNKQLCFFCLLPYLAVNAEATQCQQQKLSASSLSGERFGGCVDFDGDYAIVGDPVEDVNGATDAGAAYIFHKKNGVWVQHLRLTSDDLVNAENDFFGNAVAIDGTTIMVGADQAGPPSTPGVVFVYDFNGGSWVQSAKFSAGVGSQGLGYSIALRGNRALIGATRSGTAHGSALVFERSGDTWSEVAALTASDGQPFEYFGWSVAFDGELAIVGVPFANSNSGAAYVFDGTQSWAEVAKLVPADSQPNAFFGYDTCIQGTKIVVGAYADDAPLLDSGSIYAYKEVGGIWQQSAKLVAPDASTGLLFGWSLAMEQDVMLVGVPADPAGDSIYLYRELAGLWAFQAKLRGSDTEGSVLGASLALQGETIFAGAPNGTGPHGNIGAAYFFKMPFEFSPYCFGSDCPCGNDDLVRGCGNSVGWTGFNNPQGALLTACGSGSVGTDDLVLTLERLPQNQFGLFYMGGGASQAMFGDGLRCVSAGGLGIFRFNPPQSSGSAGILTIGPGIVARSQTFPLNGHIDPGETWYFQGWYRDPMGPCGTAFNLSNGLAVTFIP